MAQEGYVYLIWMHGTDKYKMGLSKDPESRLRQLQTANVHKLSIICTKRCNDCDAEEARLHEKFAKYRVQGEYFAFHPLFIKEILTEFDYSQEDDLEALSDLFSEAVENGIEEVINYYPQEDVYDAERALEECADCFFEIGYQQGILAFLKRLKIGFDQASGIFTARSYFSNEGVSEKRAKWGDWLTFRFGDLYSNLNKEKNNLRFDVSRFASDQERPKKVDWAAVKQHLGAKLAEVKETAKSQGREASHVCHLVPDPWSEEISNEQAA